MCAGCLYIENIIELRTEKYGSNMESTVLNCCFSHNQILGPVENEMHIHYLRRKSLNFLSYILHSFYCSVVANILRLFILQKLGKNYRNFVEQRLYYPPATTYIDYCRSHDSLLSRKMVRMKQISKLHIISEQRKQFYYRF